MNRPAIRACVCTLLAVFTCPIARGQADAAGGADRIQLTSGQNLAGTITDPSFTIISGLGTVAIPIDHVKTLLCQSPPQVGQSLEMRDGDLLVGWSAARTIHFTGDDGKAIEVPLDQIDRLEVAARGPLPPTTLPGTIAVAYGLQGDHLQVALPPSMKFRSRWGELILDSAHIHQIILSGTNQPAHRIFLGDGSELSGLLTDADLPLVPVDAAGATLQTPVGEMEKIVCLANNPPTESSPRLQMTGGDILRGALQGNIAIQTQFGDVKLSAPDIQKLGPDPGSPGDIEVNVADGRTVRGAPPQAAVPCLLLCGATVNVPMDMIASYAKSAPAGPENNAPIDGPLDPATTDQVQRLIKQLANQNNGAQRVRAQNQLVGLGKPVVGLLTQLRPQQAPRVQKQIDGILQRIQSADQQ